MHLVKLMTRNKATALHLRSATIPICSKNTSFYRRNRGVARVSSLLRPAIDSLLEQFSQDCCRACHLQCCNRC